uniref:Uncharacterized protein n=1 Tax=Romanomermis culicivorax TaxID=13658 RepID=A0A915KJX9_ROMCU
YLIFLCLDQCYPSPTYWWVTLVNTDNDRAILCDYCNNWFHCKTDDNDDLLSEVKDFAKSISFDPKEIISAKHSGLEVTPNNVTLPRIKKVKCASITAKNDLIKNVNLSQKNIERNEKICARPDLTFAEGEQVDYYANS